MCCQWLRVAMVVLLASSASRGVGAEVTDEQIQRAVDRGASFLRQQQLAQGGWKETPPYNGGVTALCTLALLRADQAREDAAISRAVDYLRTIDTPRTVYATSLRTMVLCRVGDEQDRERILKNVRWLEETQIQQGEFRGAWSYGPRRGKGDPSNSRMAVLALDVAERLKIPAAEATWQRVFDYWTRLQNEDGSWRYHATMPGTGSMTCAGIASVTLSAARLKGDEVRKRKDTSVRRGLDWLEKHFSVRNHPVAKGRPLSQWKQRWLYYYLHTLARAGDATGTVRVGEHDWYRDAAQLLVDVQDTRSGNWRGTDAVESNPLIATSFALLVLSEHTGMSNSP